MIKNLMHLSMLSLLSALVMVINGCGEDNKKPEPEKDKFKLGVIQQFEAALMNSASAKNILVTEDKKLAYVLDDKGKLWRVSLGDDAHVNMHDKTKWQLLEVVNTGLDDSVSQAKLDKGESAPQNNRRIHLTKDGIVVTGLVTGTTYYIAYIKHGDDKASLAWINDATHVDGTAWATTNRLISNGTIIAEHDNKTYVVLYIDTTGFLTSVALEKGAKVKGTHKNVAGGFLYMMMVAEKGSNAAKPGKLWIAHLDGVSFITLDKLGSDADAVAPAPEAASDKWRMNTTFITAATIDYGSGTPAATGGLSVTIAGDEGAAGTTGIQNNYVDSVVLHNAKLYISLKAADGATPGLRLRSPENGYTGGVAVYDIAANKTTAPEKLHFGGKSGPKLTMLGNDLVYVENNTIFKFDDKGHASDIVISKAKIENNAYSKKEFKLMPEKVGTTLFLLKNRQAAPTFNNFAALGEDLILYDVGGNAYSLHYRDVELPKKVEEKLPEQE